MNRYTYSSSEWTVPCHAVGQDLRRDAIAVEAEVLRALGARAGDDLARVGREPGARHPRVPVARREPGPYPSSSRQLN